MQAALGLRADVPAQISQFLDNYYASMATIYRHNRHLCLTAGCFWYWAFELAAIVRLRCIPDGAFANNPFYFSSDANIIARAAARVGHGCEPGGSALEVAKKGSGMALSRQSLARLTNQRRPYPARGLATLPPYTCSRSLELQRVG